jgi:hypothetical protein
VQNLHGSVDGQQVVGGVAETSKKGGARGGNWLMNGWQWTYFDRIVTKTRAKLSRMPGNV